MGNSFNNLDSQRSPMNQSITTNNSLICNIHQHEVSFTYSVVLLTIAGLGFPLTLASIFAVYSLIRKDHVAPIYVINLLITDLIQLCCMIILALELDKVGVCQVADYIHQFAAAVSISFMIVVALERYLMIAWPLWYKFRRNIRMSLIVCVVVWIIPLFYFPIFFFAGDYVETTIASFLILPFPLLIFFLAGTLKALSAARSVPPDEKRRIVAILVLVLLIYTLLFLPRIILSTSNSFRKQPNVKLATVIPVYFSPLADLGLYVFMKKGVCDKLLAWLCCCTMENYDVSSSIEDVITSHSSRSLQRDEGEKKDVKIELTGRS